MRRIILALGFYVFTLPANAQPAVSAQIANNRVVNYEAEMQSMVAVGVGAGTADVCGLRSETWSTKLLSAITDDAQGMAENLWPGDNNGLSYVGTVECKKELIAILNAFRQGQEAGPSDCASLANSGHLARMDEIVADTDKTDGTAN